MKRSSKQIVARLALAFEIGAVFTKAAFASDSGGASRANTNRPKLAPVSTPNIDSERRGLLARAIADARHRARGGKLTKNELRAPMHRLVPLLGVCYRRATARDPDIAGVINTQLTVASLAGEGTIIRVRGFDTSGGLGQSKAFRDCMKETVEAVVLPPIGAGGTAEVSYPITFAPMPPDNRHTQLADRANEAANAGRWDDALLSAERGLQLTSLDGTFRRKLIAIAGAAACHLKLEAKARHYYALASATFETEIREACARDASIDLRRPTSRRR